MNDHPPIEKTNPESAVETLLERPTEALVDEATQALRRTVKLRVQAQRLKAPAGEAQGTSRRRVSTIARTGGAGVGFVQILREDPELASALPARDARELVEAMRAPVISIRSGPWNPPHHEPDSTYGLLVLEGLLARRVTVGAGTMIELLSHGDILRPSQNLAERLVPAAVRWRALTESRVAVLDERVTALIGSRPELTVAFAARLARRCHAAAYLGAIGHMGRVEDRLLGLLWHLADTWGRVTPDGVRIPFRLTHEVLGELVGAKRPSVTIGLSYLRREGEVTQSSSGQYILTGEPPRWHPDD
jgi:CRP/FNR family transcriptional regulator, cyclic AMP receptor protein